MLGEKSGGSHEPMLTNKDGTRILKPVDEADRLDMGMNTSGNRIVMVHQCN